MITDNIQKGGGSGGSSIPLPVSIPNGGTGATDAATARTNLGLGSLATKNSISSSEVTGLGTAATKDYTTSVSSGSSNLVTSGAVYSALSNKMDIPSGSVGSGTNLMYLNNGTFTASTSNIGQDGSGSAIPVYLKNGVITQITGELSTSYGGTGASSPDGARTKLGVPPTSHASTATTYGKGTSSSYGHLKVSDTYTSSVGAASDGVAASQKAVYNVYTVANGKQASLAGTQTSNANNAETVGWHYLTSSASNTPSSAWWMIDVNSPAQNIKNSWGVQIAHATEFGTAYKRRYISGSWSTWQPCMPALATTRVDSFSSGKVTLSFSALNVRSRPACVLLTPQSNKDAILAYNYDESSSKVVIYATHISGTAFSGALRYSIAAYE